MCLGTNNKVTKQTYSIDSLVQGARQYHSTLNTGTDSKKYKKYKMCMIFKTYTCINPGAMMIHF